MDSFPDIQTGERCRDLMYEVDQSSQCGSRPVTWVDESVVSLLILCVFRSARCVSLNHPRKFPEQAGARTDLGRLSYPATTTGSLLGLAMGGHWSLGKGLARDPSKCEVGKYHFQYAQDDCPYSACLSISS